MLRGLGVLAAIAAWLGWLTLCPAFGFPSLALAAMLNRVLVPRDDPGFWLGWAELLIGLAAAALLFLAATARGRLRPSIASGAVYGVIWWLIAGAVVMPLLGVLSPAPATAPGAPASAPDAMQGAFMMLPLGVGAPLAALIAWLLFGTVLGASASVAREYPALAQLFAALRERAREPGGALRVTLGAIGVVVAVVAIGAVFVRLTAPSVPAPATAIAALATEGEKALPKGPDFFSVIELSQPPGATLGPHAHPYFGFAYGLRGVATIEFNDGQATRVGPGDVGYIAIQATHAHENTDDRLPSAILCLSIVGLAAIVCGLSLRTGRVDRRLLPVALVSLVVVGSVAALDPWANHWLFLSVRSSTGRGGAMPLATSSRTYESPDFGPLAGPSKEAFDEVTLQPDAAATDVSSTGATLLFVLDGAVDVQPTDGASTPIGTHGATILQPGTSAALTDGSAQPAHVLEVQVSPAPAGS